MGTKYRGADGVLRERVEAVVAGSNAGVATSVTPNDDTDLALVPTEFLSVNTSGNVTLTTEDGDTVTVYLTRGYLHKIKAARVLDTGTDATGIVAWYDPSLSYAAGAEDFLTDGLVAGWDMARPAGTQIWLDERGRHVITAGATSAVEVYDPTFDGAKAILDGSNDFLNIYGAALNEDFDGAAGTVVVFAQVSAAGVWTDAATRYLINIGADGNNCVRIFKGSTANQVLYRYIAGGTTDTVIDTTAVGTTKAMFALTWDKAAEELKAYLNGAQVGTTQASLGTWAGSLASTQCFVGAVSATGMTPWSGNIYGARVYDRALTAGELAAMYLVAVDRGVAG